MSRGTEVLCGSRATAHPAATQLPAGTQARHWRPTSASSRSCWRRCPRRTCSWWIATSARRSARRLRVLIIAQQGRSSAPPNWRDGTGAYAATGLPGAGAQRPDTNAELTRGAGRGIARPDDGAGRAVRGRQVLADAPAYRRCGTDHRGRAAAGRGRQAYDHGVAAVRLRPGWTRHRFARSPRFRAAIDDLEPTTLGFREVAQLAGGCRFRIAATCRNRNARCAAPTADGTMDRATLRELSAAAAPA